MYGNGSALKTFSGHDHPVFVTVSQEFHNYRRNVGSILILSHR